jgi:predicted glycosyltransferase
MSGVVFSWFKKRKVAPQKVDDGLDPLYAENGIIGAGHSMAPLLELR